MAEFPLVPISSFQTRWDADGKTIRGRVITKSALRTYTVPSTGDGEDMFCFTISDGAAENQKIEVVTFNDEARERFDTIVLNECYSMSKFTTDNSQEPGLEYSNIQQIDKLKTLKDGDAANVMGVCKEVGELKRKFAKSSRRNVDFRKIRLIDPSGVRVKVKLWAYEAAGFDLEIRKIVYLYGARKNTRNGKIKLRTVMNTMMLCEGRDLPEDIPGLQELKDWWQKNTTDVIRYLKM